MIVVILILNLFKFHFGSDLVIVTFAVFALVKGESTQFVKDWTLPVVLIFLYEALRGHAYEFGSKIFHYEPVAQLLIDIERALFFFLDDVPTVVLQRAMRPDYAVSSWYDYGLFLFYLSFFFYFMGAGLIIWWKKRKYFNAYIYGLVGMSFFCAFIYFLVPTAPPWWASKQGLLPHTERIMWISEYFPRQHSIISTYANNDFAALPSLHAAWPFFASLFLVKAFGKKMLLLFIVPFLVVFATWYGAEHYVIDSIAGWIVAVLAYLVAMRVFERKED